MLHARPGVQTRHETVSYANTRLQCHFELIDSCSGIQIRSLGFRRHHEIRRCRLNRCFRRPSRRSEALVFLSCHVRMGCSCQRTQRSLGCSLVISRHRSPRKSRSPTFRPVSNVSSLEQRPQWLRGTRSWRFVDRTCWSYK
jgi:hypothetical protein